MSLILSLIALSPADAAVTTLEAPTAPAYEAGRWSARYTRVVSDACGGADLDALNTYSPPLELYPLEGGFGVSSLGTVVFRCALSGEDFTCASELPDVASWTGSFGTAGSAAGALTVTGRCPVVVGFTLAFQD